jgi:hypothetical protein
VCSRAAASCGQRSKGTRAHVRTRALSSSSSSSSSSFDRRPTYGVGDGSSRCACCPAAAAGRAGTRKTVTTAAGSGAPPPALGAPGLGVLRSSVAAARAWRARTHSATAATAATAPSDPTTAPATTPAVCASEPAGGGGGAPSAGRGVHDALPPPPVEEGHAHDGDADGVAGPGDAAGDADAVAGGDAVADAVAGAGVDAGVVAAGDAVAADVADAGGDAVAEKVTGGDAVTDAVAGGDAVAEEVTGEDADADGVASGDAAADVVGVTGGDADAGGVADGDAVAAARRAYSRPPMAPAYSVPSAPMASGVVMASPALYAHRRLPLDADSAVTVPSNVGTYSVPPPAPMTGEGPGVLGVVSVTFHSVAPVAPASATSDSPVVTNTVPSPDTDAGRTPRPAVGTAHRSAPVVPLSDHTCAPRGSGWGCGSVGAWERALVAAQAQLLEGHRGR